MGTLDDRTQTRLSHLSGSRIGEVQLLGRNSILIGRSRHNDVILDAFKDPTVSSQHAEIRREQEGFVLYDMGSLNGTLLNGFPVRRASLREGDEIGLGKRGPRLKFELEQQKDAGKGRETSESQPMVVEDGNISMSPIRWAILAAFAGALALMLHRILT